MGQHSIGVLTSYNERIKIQFARELLQLCQRMDI